MRTKRWCVGRMDCRSAGGQPVMNVLVTGGAGYIGSVATEELLRAGHSVVVFDNLLQGHRAAVHPDAAFVRGDLRDLDAIERVFIDYPSIEGIMHFASSETLGDAWLYQ